MTLESKEAYWPIIPMLQVAPSFPAAVEDNEELQLYVMSVVHGINVIAA
jgi:hypothetical protein